MNRYFPSILLLVLTLMLASLAAAAQRGGGRAVGYHHAGGAYGGYSGYAGYGYGAYPFLAGPWEPQTYLPNYWWVSPYPIADPRQDGYNPSSGYEWSSVGALILNTNPPQARVTLNGIYASTADKLGPFQLPVGQHTLRIEAAGYEPLDVVVRFDKPGVQTLDLALKPLSASPKPRPRT